MMYCSTRDKSLLTDAPGAVLCGLAPDGGLFTANTLPHFTAVDIGSMGAMDYKTCAAFVMERFFDGYEKAEIERFAGEAYGDNFASSEVAPLVRVREGLYSLELFHGPTCAFKDFALQMLPRLLVSGARKKSGMRETAILVATSGDTGKAAMCGFADVEGTKIGVFYPHGGVSEMQRLQMATQQGSNVNVFAVRGNFDDAQTGVKKIFGDRALEARLKAQGTVLSSANSINWGRLAPQIAYYFWGYSRLVKSSAIKNGDKIDFCVPTGNFGNILAGYLAKKSGLPVQRLICASNKNNVLTDFLSTGVYDRNRPLFATDSPSMDILVSSNLERLLFLLFGDEAVRGMMDELSACGRYDIGAERLAKIRAEGFCGYFADDVQARAQIKKIWREDSYLCDTHTAVGMCAARSIAEKRPCVVVSTASPFKFAPAIIKALSGRDVLGGLSAVSELSALCGLAAPAPLSALSGLPERFSQVIECSEMSEKAEGWLKNI